MLHFKTAIGRVRAVGILEGISFLLLMGIAMPLKYFAGMPRAVTYTGWIHGVLFVAYGAVVFKALIDRKISFGWSVAAFFASLIPFGPFLIDRRLAASEARSDDK